MHSERRGITLIETLVVISILGVLVAMLFPAVHYARESSRRATCQNNLRQIAIAIQNHESAHTALPSLYNGKFFTRSPTLWDEFHYHSWRTAILPHLEQNALFKQIDWGLAASDQANQKNFSSSIPVFLCPSTNNTTSVVPEVAVFNGTQFPTQKIGPAARSDYEVVAGVYGKDVQNADPVLGHVQFGAWGMPAYVLNGSRSDVSYRISRFRNISDGLSNTILISERGGRPDLFKHGKLVKAYGQHDADSTQAAWGISTHIGWLVKDENSSINDSNYGGIYSFHTSGANTAFADGSVKFLSERTAASVLDAMVTRSSGDVVKFE